MGFKVIIISPQFYDYYISTIILVYRLPFTVHVMDQQQFRFSYSLGKSLINKLIFVSEVKDM